MSALRKTKEAPRPRRLTAKDSMYAGLTAAQVQDGLRSTSYAGVALLADLIRICRDKAQIHFVHSIYTHTIGCPSHGDFFRDRWHEASKAKEPRAPKFTPPMLPEDFAKEVGFTRQAFSYVLVGEENISLIQDACDRGIVERKCECGKSRPPVADRASCPDGDNHYRFRPLIENWSSVQSVGVNLRKPIQSELDKADHRGEEEENTQATAVARVVRVKAKSRFKMTAGTRYIVEDAKLTEIEYQIETPASARVDQGVLKIRQSAAASPKATVIAMPAAASAPAPPPPSPAAAHEAPGSADAIAPEAELALVKKLLPALPASEAAELATRAAAVDLTRYRAFRKEIAERWGRDIQDAWLCTVIARAQHTGAAHGCDANDELLARAVRAETKATQKAAGLYLTTIPNYVERYAISRKTANEETGDGEASSMLELRLAARKKVRAMHDKR